MVLLRFLRLKLHKFDPADLMQQIIFILATLIMVYLLFSCESSNPLTSDSKGQEITELQGKLIPWNHGEDKKILMVSMPGFLNHGDSIYSSSSIRSDGTFVLKNILEASDDMMLNHAYDQFGSEGIIDNRDFYCSDSTAMIAFCQFFIVDNEDPETKIKGSVERRNFNSINYLVMDSVKQGDFNSEFIYVNKPVRLNGTIYVDYLNDDFNIRFLSKYNYDLNYKVGWNRKVAYVVNQTVTREDSLTTIVNEKTFINNEPQGGRWEYSYYPD